MAAAASSFASDEKRVALLIGNAAYRHGPPLTNPPTDAAALAGAFERLAFASVTRLLDLEKSAQDQALRRFTTEAKSADMAVIYYAGHGIEVEGENYLLPVDAELSDASSLGFEATRLSDIMRAVEGARKFRFVILDACRDNPFRGRMLGGEGTRSLGARGLAPVEPPGNTLVAYAARHGTTAKDGAKGQNSPYAAALLDRIETPNLDIRLLLGHVRDDVMAATNNQQQPFFYGTLGGAQIQLKIVAAAPAAPLTSGEQAELLRALQEERDWERALRTNTEDGFNAFLAVWPNGRFAEQAPERILEARMLQETIEWEQALHTNDVGALQSFRMKWPGGIYANEAAEKIQAAADREQELAYKAVIDATPNNYNRHLNKPEPLRDYLERFPHHANADDVKSRLLGIDAGYAKAFQEKLSKSLAQEYLDKFPQGAASAKARGFIDGAGDDQLWIKVLGTNDDIMDASGKIKALEDYLADWPDGRHASEAKSHIERLKRRQTKATVIGATAGLAIWGGGLAVAIAIATWALPQLPNMEQLREMLAKLIQPEKNPENGLPSGTIFSDTEINDALRRNKGLDVPLKTAPGLGLGGLANRPFSTFPNPSATPNEGRFTTPLDGKTAVQRWLEQQEQMKKGSAAPANPLGMESETGPLMDVTPPASSQPAPPITN